MRNLEWSNSDTESPVVVVRGWKEGKWGAVVKRACSIWLGKLRMSWKYIVMMVAQQCECI
jgi:hypothetical protein